VVYRVCAGYLVWSRGYYCKVESYGMGGVTRSGGDDSSMREEKRFEFMFRRSKFRCVSEKNTRRVGYQAPII
jgi:hypothetical protein